MSFFSRLFRRKKTGIYKVDARIPLRITGKYISLELHYANNFTHDEKLFYIDMLNIAATVFNSVEFKIFVTSEREMLFMRNYTPVEIYNYFMSGKSTIEPVEDNDIDIKITMYNDLFSNVIGYTFPNVADTWLNRKYFYFNDAGKALLVGNLCHEYMHKLNFTHSYKNPEQMSVPYFYGNIASFLAKKIIKGQMLTPL